MSVQPKPVTQQLSPLAAQIAARARQQSQHSEHAQPPRPPVSLVQMRPVPVAEVLSPSTPIFHQDDIESWNLQLRQAVDGHRNTLVEIAYYGAKIRAANGWEKLGFVDEDGYREDVGLGEKTWKEYLKLGERLSHLSLEQMSRLTFKAARLLTRVDGQIWSEFAWAEEAALLPAREFAMLVDQRNREVNPAIKIEARGRLSVEVGLSQLEPMERKIESLKKQCRLQSTAAAVNYALEAAERQSSLIQRVANLESSINELARLWQTSAPWSTELSEPDSERDARLKAGAPTGLSDAAVLSQRITRRILRSLKEFHEVLPETSQSATSKSHKPDSTSAAR